MQLNLDGRHALVCGASQGIGRAAAIELALLGANVTLLARRADVLETLAAELPRTCAGQRHGFVAVDVSDTATLRTRAEALVADSPVHILVNNSGGPAPGSVLDATPEDFLAAWQQHLLACHTLAQTVVPSMRAAGWGRIVNVISTSVREPIPGIGVSNTTRGAVASWAKTLAGELAPFGITVNNVLPGSTRTPRIEQIVAARAQKSGKPLAEVQQAMEAEVPMRRFADAAEIAAAVAFLASPAASYITGVSLAVDGGRMRSL
ncbi:SDR family oxidoreductase [Rhodanobacter sp. DHG33]|uniref:SDR family oxidoreductase n=1 Tax=Rhodanobacter sp. DHG33 TaxID=2775921 RepID=UPI0017833A36|nr:SDR family oxidoreductase [Rhodanobacter sp. DHG33]MBD8900132.1 SDR family oxidoreductase [Rhodanobacter sp. DHG33]